MLSLKRAVGKEYKSEKRERKRARNWEGVGGGRMERRVRGHVRRKSRTRNDDETRLRNLRGKASNVEGRSCPRGGGGGDHGGDVELQIADLCVVVVVKVILLLHLGLSVDDESDDKSV